MDTTTGAKAVIWGSIGTDLIGVAYDLRYMVICSFALILADLWWGYQANKKKYDEAYSKGNDTLKEKFKWRKSRAVRRTMNKTIDYMTYLLVGAFVGLAITEPMDICSHVWTAAIGLGVGCGCEIASIIGHIAYVKMGLEISIADVWRLLIRFFGRLIKIKSAEIGDAVESIANESEARRECESMNDIEPINNEDL